MTMERLLIAGLATWCITHLLMIEDGPHDVFTSFRSAVSRVKLLAPLLECIWCFSFWVGLLVSAVVVIDLPFQWWFILLPFALNITAVMGERCLEHR